MKRMRRLRLQSKGNGGKKCSTTWDNALPILIKNRTYGGSVTREVDMPKRMTLQQRIAMGFLWSIDFLLALTFILT